MQEPFISADAFHADQLITLTYVQLQNLVKQAAAEATEPLKEEARALRLMVDRLEVMREVYHGPATWVEEMAAYCDVFAKKREAG